MNDGEYLTTHDAARPLGLTTARVRQLADMRRLPTIRTASGWRLFAAADVQRYARERAAGRSGGDGHAGASDS